MSKLNKKSLMLFVSVFLVGGVLMFIPVVHSFMHSAITNTELDASPDAISDDSEADDYATHVKWAKEVQKGGYVLHFRHAQREKWNDVTAFDALELRQGLKAENESFARATCLTMQGVEEAKMMGEILTMTGVGISTVYTSPSCRARQTSQHAFGGEGTLVNSLLHRTAIAKDQHKAFAMDLRQVIEEAKIVPGKNVVLSGHGGTLRIDKTLVVDESFVEAIDGRQEGGFIVLEKADGKIIARHKFASFHDYANAVVELPISQ